MNRSRILSIAAALSFGMTACTQQLEIAAEAPELNVNKWQDSVSFYQAKARYGDGQAYLRLAQFYHDGQGVDHDFMMTWSMAQMAAQYGAIHKGEDYFRSLPSEDSDRLLMEAMDDIGWGRKEAALQKADLLSKQGSPDGDMIKAAIDLDEGKTEQALSLFAKAANEGSDMAKLALAVKEDYHQSLLNYAYRLPQLYCSLARDCFEHDVSQHEDEQAATYYVMADERLCLDATGVRWLLSYYEHQTMIGGAIPDSIEMQRLRILSQKLSKDRKKEREKPLS